MDYSSRNQDRDNRYQFPQENSTIANLVQSSHESQHLDDPYTVGSRRTGDKPYETVKRIADNRQETDRRSNNPEYTRRVVPTADVLVDPYRRPAHGNARTCVMEINIAVSFGGDRRPQGSVATNNFSSKQPAIRSTAIIDDVHYVDLNFHSPEHTAQFSTDGIIRQLSPRTSAGFQNKTTNE